jgi:hypothetical protein
VRRYAVCSRSVYRGLHELTQRHTTAFRSVPHDCIDPRARCKVEWIPRRLRRRPRTGRCQGNARHPPQRRVLVFAGDEVYPAPSQADPNRQDVAGPGAFHRPPAGLLRIGSRHLGLPPVETRRLHPSVPGKPGNFSPLAARRPLRRQMPPAPRSEQRTAKERFFLTGTPSLPGSA